METGTMTADGIPETVVFDAEPLIAYFCGEPGSDVVEAYVDAVTSFARSPVKVVPMQLSM